MTQHHAVTSSIYLDMLQLYAVPQFPEGVIFQQDGAPPHYGNIVRQFLNTTFPQRWIGRDVVMAWPPRSPDLTPLDFYLRGYVKQHVYSERINVINHLKQRITDVVHSVTPDVLKREWEELDYRLDIKVWSDSESSLHSIASFDTKSPIAQQTQEILLKSTNIKLGWIRAHVVYSGNEVADVLAKKATQEGIPIYIPTPRNHIKSLLQKESIIRWQKEWDNGQTGRSVHSVLPKVKTTPTPWQRPEIMFLTGHGPFPTYLKRFNIRSSDSCGSGDLGNPLHYATSCLFATSYHLTKSSADLEPLWWKRVMNNNNSRAKIRKLVHFIAENETLLFPKGGDNN
ncbi:hypothetical protein AVEN_228741-1 [Araneus ventricosus]|uniref:Uncharacterized protein n=1 Tax=Araneus ventricosus TaxID=182803 RepID=A0A4Y2Q348_ARAVE|nr:hypothetical protein AVEN_228741-1 [Araneus ventricosus]